MTREVTLVHLGRLGARWLTDVREILITLQ